jgi:hypothetical protein
MLTPGGGSGGSGAWKLDDAVVPGVVNGADVLLDGVRTDLGWTSGSRGHNNGAVGNEGDVLEGLALTPAELAPVHTAMVSLLGAQSRRVGFVLNTVDAGIRGVRGAYDAYRQSDEDMAAVVQSAALVAATTGDVSELNRLGAY